MIYRIYTEATGHYRDNAIAEVAKEFNSFTVYAADGYWKGKPEASVVVEIVAPGNSLIRDKVLCVAHNIRRTNAQESVCVVEVYEAEHTQCRGI